MVDIIQILTESKNSNVYWRKLKQRLNNEGNESVTNCHGLKMKATDGKMRMTDCANWETIFRIIQSVPSPNAEPFKLWFARLAEERIQEVIDPSLAIDRARQTYKKLNKNENLRDNMSPIELALTTLAEVTTTELHRTNDSYGMRALKNDANTGGSIASTTRVNIEKQLGKKVLTSENAKNFQEEKKIENK